MDPHFGPADVKLRVTRSVAVSEELPELAKNQLLAGAVLGRTVDLPDPGFEAWPEHLRIADTELGRIGFEAESYWVACVGDSTFTQVRNWEPQRWAELLSHWAQRLGGGGSCWSVMNRSFPP
jgi:hypothetical protein